MLISVTRNNIEQGCQECAFECPIALALKDEGWIAHVGPSKLVLIGHPRENAFPQYFESSIVIETPGLVRRRINYYDRTGKMKPFTFKLEVEEPDASRSR